MPLVSVVLPVFNAAGTLPAAVASIQRQTLADWELLVVEDGSVDGTLGIAMGLARCDSRIRVLPQAHGGIVAALQRGMSEARGTFIARMDADDVSHPNRLQTQAAFLQAHAEIGLVSCLVAYGGERAANEGYALHVDWLNTVCTPAAIRLNRFVESPLAHPSVMFRRDLLAQHGGYAAGDFPEDYELWLRWLEAGVGMAKVPEILLTWQDGAQRLSRTDARYGYEAFYALKAHYLAREVQRLLSGRDLWIWGAGRPTRVRAEQLTGHGMRISGYIDIDPRKAGRRFQGRVTVLPPDIPARETAFVAGYVAKRGARELIRAQLCARGFVEGRDFLMAA